MTSYGIFHLYYIYCSFKLLYFPRARLEALGRSIGVPWEVPWDPLGGSGRVLWGPLGSQGFVPRIGAHAFFVQSLFSLVFLRKFKGCGSRNPGTKISPFLGPAYDTGVRGSPKLLAKAKSAESERRHEARVEDSGSDTPWAQGPANLSVLF